MNQKSLTLDSPLLFIYFNFFYIAQIVVLGLGTRCPPRDPSLPVSCSPAPHHVFPEGPLDGHGRNAVFDENAFPYSSRLSCKSNNYFPFYKTFLYLFVKKDREGEPSVLHHRSLSGIHRKITKGCLDFINAILR